MKNSCIYGSKRITRTCDNAGKTELLPLRAPERISEQAFNWSLEGWALSLLRFASLRWQQVAIIANERTLHVCFQYCYLDIFTKTKLVFKNTNSSFGLFFRCFACRWNLCLRDKYSAVYWSIRQVEKSLFISLLDCCIFIVQT